MTIMMLILLTILAMLATVYHILAFLGVYRLLQREHLGNNIGAIFPFVRTFIFYRIAENMVGYRNRSFELGINKNPRRYEVHPVKNYMFYYVILIFLPLLTVFAMFLFPPFILVGIFSVIMLFVMKIRAFSLIAESYSESPDKHILIAILTLGLSIYIQCFFFSTRKKVKRVKKEDRIL